MKPRPVFRSLTFWSGILVIGFLCWATRDSIGSYSYAHGGPFALSNMNGVLFLDNFGSGGWTVGRNPAGERTWERFPPPVFQRGLEMESGVLRPRPANDLRAQIREGMSAQAKDDWILAIPHWLLLLLAGVSWCGLLLWRARRQARAAAATALSDS